MSKRDEYQRAADQLEPNAQEAGYVADTATATISLAISMKRIADQFAALTESFGEFVELLKEVQDEPANRTGTTDSQGNKRSVELE